ncbi:MAG: VOC family protein [Acidobacteria bacterium]|nr:VOC family protein [Acidobacteriota bacterium]
MDPIPVESFHAILHCRNWEACVSFYRDILGFEEADVKPGFVEVRVAPGSLIGLLRSLKNDNPRGALLSFRVGNVDKVRAMLAERCREVSAVRVHPWGARLFELRDPDGRRLEFWTPQ